MNSLIEHLKKVKNFRRLQGQRHPLWFILLIVILGLMNGYYGSRALGSFARSQQQAKEMGVSFCLRLKKNHCLETEKLIWQRLDQLGVVPGTSLYFQGVRVRKTRPV